MKYILLSALLIISGPSTILAHDGSGHVEVAWYQDIPQLTILSAFLLIAVLMAGSGYYLPRYRKVFAGIGAVSVLFGVVGYQMNQVVPAQVNETVLTSLTGVPVTVYRTEGCTCCTGFSKELSATGAEVTIETISATEMVDLKHKHGIAKNQESCHTSLIEGYVVEGHVPFEAIAKLLDERPEISGITLPGMPMGTPGMPGRQTEAYIVNTLDREPFWQSS